MWWCCIHIEFETFEDSVEFKKCLSHLSRGNHKECKIPAKVEDLAVIPDKGCALSRVAGGAAEVALLDPHPDFGSTKLITAASETEII